MDKFTNAEGKNVFESAYALVAENRQKAKRQWFETLAKAETLAKQAMEPKIQFDGVSATAYMVHIQ